MNVEVSKPSPVAPNAPGFHEGAKPDFNLSARKRARRRLSAPGWSLVSLAVLALVGTLLWYNGVNNYFYPRNWGEVEPGFYRSGQVSRFLIERTLRKNRIDLVVFMSGDKANRPDVQAEAAVCQKLGVTRINCPLAGDGTGDVNSYVDAIEAVWRARKEGRAVLVHCHTGSQRTGGVVAFYRLLIDRRPPGEVYAELKEYGHDPRDNPKLIPYLNDHMGEVSAALAARGIIDRVPAPPPIIDLEPVDN